MVKHTSFIITGPTASGKSDFAHKLAKRINGTIINCDSVQVYRGIENISASPFAGIDAKDSIIDGVPYKLFSCASLDQQISVVDYLAMARAEHDAAIADGRVPIFVGGSGYYISVLVNGISPVPDVSKENRERARKMVSDFPDAVSELLPEDFIPTDPQRTARALEVFLETGELISQWQSMPRRGAIKPSPFKILVNPHRDILRDRIKARIPKMMAGGAINEAKLIQVSDWDENRAIGASELCKLLRGEISEATAKDNWATRTVQYAKRQRTWFRNQYAVDMEIGRVPNDDDLEKILKS